MVGHVDAQRLESGAELIEGDHVVAVLVQATEQVNGVCLKGAVLAGALLDLADNVLKSSFWELIWIVLHVLFSVFVG